MNQAAVFKFVVKRKTGINMKEFCQLTWDEWTVDIMRHEIMSEIDDWEYNTWRYDYDCSTPNQPVGDGAINDWITLNIDLIGLH